MCNRENTQAKVLKMCIEINPKYKSYPCNTCDYKCSSKTHLLSHIRTHATEKPHVSSMCDYTSAHNNEPHMKTHNGEEPYKLTNFCNHERLQTSSLNADIKVHNKDKTLDSYMCDNTTTTNLFNKHMIMYTADKPYGCDTCHQKFGRKSHLKDHIKIHTGEKPYKCHMCTYKCSRKSHLNIHMKMHTGEKPFKCRICDYKATQTCDLNRHMKIHTGEKPFKCKMCDYVTAYMSDLHRHLKRHTKFN